MDFRKKLKTRLYLAIAYMVIGAVMIACSLITKTQNSFVSSFGLVIFVIGFAKMKQYFWVSKSDVSVKKREIYETDERNVDIIRKSRSAAFISYVIAMSIIIIVLSVLQMHDIARWFSISAILLVVIYWVCYFVIRKKF